MPDQTIHFSTQRLTGEWQVRSMPLDDNTCPTELSFAEALTVPDSTYIQLVLFPDQPFWGDRLREINEKAWVYRRVFTTPDGEFRRTRLYFEGVDYYAEVWLNGQWSGRHEGHFVPFDLDVTDALHDPGEENELLVKISSPWDEPNPKGTYPTDHVIRGMVKGSYEHGEGLIPPNVNPLGIWRPVQLVQDQGISIDHIRIRTHLEGDASLRFTLTNATDQVWQGNLKVEVSPDNHDGIAVTELIHIQVKPGTDYFEFTLHINDAKLWWPRELGQPNLYRLRATLLDEKGTLLSELEAFFGFRTVRLERSPERFTYYINEIPLFIRGSSYMPGLYLSQHDEASLNRDIQLAWEANLNLLRVHVHVSPPELYTLCDRQGMLIWQDFELNWVHDTSLEFEARARVLQREMIDMLGNHPSIITWTCHNEPTMVFTQRHNLEEHPDPALYADALAQDPTRPVFICSGQLEDDWQRSGDTHSYYGAIWTKDYTDVYHLDSYISTEFGIEIPASEDTLSAYPFAWERLQHLEGKIDELWAYQFELTQFHIEHFRRLRATCCAGYIHFWLVDLVPQVGCGALDFHRQPKGGYQALRHASCPLHVAMEHDGSKPIALWVFNDTMKAYPQSSIRWRVYDQHRMVLLEDETTCAIVANASQQILPIQWAVAPKACNEVELSLVDNEGNTLATNVYYKPFDHRKRPKGYPWNFDFELGTKVFDKPGAPSLSEASGNGNPIMNATPRFIKETMGEWIVRQKLPTPIVSFIARLLDPLA